MAVAVVTMWITTAVFWVYAPKTTSGILRLTGQGFIAMNSICECVLEGSSEGSSAVCHHADYSSASYG